LASKYAGGTNSNSKKASLLEKRGVLLHQIEKWRQLQAVYMPGALDVGASDPASSPKAKAKSIKLWLPSQLDAEDRDSICLGGIVDREKELRFAQLEDTLNDLRRARRIRYGLITFHKIQLTGEGGKIQTKSRAVVQTVQDRIDKHARRYRVARDALLCLDPRKEWQDMYLPLAEADNRGPGKEPEEKLLRDGQYALSWIWRSSATSVSPDEVNKDMRVEWAQSVARADRWEEEVILLREEMRRVVQFLEWRSSDWFAKADSRTGAVTSSVRAGLSAYANKQGSVFHNITVRFTQRWRPVLISLSLPHAWATEFLEAHKEPLTNPDFKKYNELQVPSWLALMLRPRLLSPMLVSPPCLLSPMLVSSPRLLSQMLVSSPRLQSPMLVSSPCLRLLMLVSYPLLLLTLVPLPRPQSPPSLTPHHHQLPLNQSVTKTKTLTSPTDLSMIAPRRSMTGLSPMSPMSPVTACKTTFFG
jgi:hypothetical protein